MSLKSIQSSTAAASIYADIDSYEPSTDIGSGMTRNYKLESANTQIPLYICGDCYSSQSLKNNDAIRCKDCGYRILYKQRMRKPMLYSAQ